MLRIISATVLIAVASVSIAGAACAAPLARPDDASRAQISSQETFVQSVHWERRGHRRVWVPDHRRPERGYDHR